MHERIVVVVGCGKQLNGVTNHFHFLSSTATEYHLGLLKAKLAKYRIQLIEGSQTKSEKVITKDIDRIEMRGGGNALLTLRSFNYTMQW